MDAEASGAKRRKDTIRAIAGCDSIKFRQSTLIDNQQWRDAGDRVVGRKHRWTRDHAVVEKATNEKAAKKFAGKSGPEEANPGFGIEGALKGQGIDGTDGVTPINTSRCFRSAAPYLPRWFSRRLPGCWRCLPGGVPCAGASRC